MEWNAYFQTADKECAGWRWVEGAGKSTREGPQHNLTRDPYFTDGLRVVLFLSNEPVEPAAVHFEDWRDSD